MPVIGSKEGEYSDKPNAVLATTDAKLMAVKYTGSNGRIEDAVVMIFGKAEDGDPGVFVLMDAERMRDNLKVAFPHVRAGVLKALKEAETKQGLAKGTSDDAALKAIGG